MSALAGKVQSFQLHPDKDYMVWFKESVEGLPGYMVTTDAHLIVIDGEFVMITPGIGVKIIHISEVDRFQACRSHQLDEMLQEEIEQYEARQ